LKREISYMENVNANEEITYKYLINFALIFLKRNAVFDIVFAHYNIALPKITRRIFTRNKGPVMPYKTRSVARIHETWNEKCEKTWCNDACFWKYSRVCCRDISVCPTVCTMVPERFVPHAVSELPELICAAGLLSGCSRRQQCKLDILVSCWFGEIFSFNSCFKIYDRVHLSHSLLFTVLI
jgi:hypothetical protein